MTKILDIHGIFRQENVLNLWNFFITTKASLLYAIGKSLITPMLVPLFRIKICIYQTMEVSLFICMNVYAHNLEDVPVRYRMAIDIFIH